MQKIFLLVLLTTLHICLISATTLDRLVFTSRQLSTVDGLSSNTVYDFLQDRNGFMWMGAVYGLCRYDGYQFTNFYSLGGKGTQRIDANVGNLYEDRHNKLIWIQSATYHFACYNEQTGQFDNFTTQQDSKKVFRRFLLVDGVAWMYDTNNGARRVAYHDGQYQCTDYTLENKMLPGNRVSRLVTDNNGNVWMSTNGGIVMVSPQGKSRIISRGQYLELCTWKGLIYCIKSSGQMEIYTSKGCLLRRVPNICSSSELKSIRSQLVWQGQWILFGNKTICIPLDNPFALIVDSPIRNIEKGLLLNSINDYQFVSDKNNRLWIFPPKGEARCLNLLSDMRFTPERNRLYTVARGNNGFFYIATVGNGLFVYDYEHNAIRHLLASDVQPVISTNVLTDIMVGRDGTLWVAQESAGVAQISVSDMSVATFIDIVKGRQGDWANFVCMIDTKATDGQVFFSTRDNKLYKFYPQTNTISLVKETPSCVNAILTDKKGRTWMATRNSGLYIDNVCYSKGDKHNPLPNNRLVDMVEDGQGRVWIATIEDGLILAQPQKDGNVKFTTFLSRTINEGRIHQLKIDEKGHLWIASNNGIYMVDTHKKYISNRDFYYYGGQNGNHTFGEVHCLYPTQNNTLWIGGKGYGLVKCELSANGQLLHTVTIDKNNGLASNNITAIIKDRFGNIWASTENGLSVVYDHDMKVKTFLFGTSFHRNAYPDGTVLPLPDGRLLFGTQAGLTVISPYDIKSRVGNKTTTICITGISVNGRSVAEDSLIDFAPAETKSMELKANENTLTFYFSNFDYSDNRTSLYQYYLEGIDNHWRPMNSKNSVEYAGLQPGTYTFHVKSLTDNQWSEEQTLTVTILQPWYNSLWAWLVYLVVIALVASYLYHNAREKFRLHQQMTINNQLNEFRISFFTNIAHEFRTPLAIIQGAVDQLHDSGDRSSRVAVQTARRGTRRLLRMVNRLMEFRKVNTGNMRLQVEKGDIVPFIQNIYHDFWTLARQKNLSINFVPFNHHYEVVFDPQMIETIVYNMLSNAVKYTPTNGCISVTLQHIEQKLVFTVTDSGPGISQDHLSSLFTPFMHGQTAQGGMGIGLYTSHEMAMLHHGQLTYHQATNEGGSVFTFSWPDNNDEYSASEYRNVEAINDNTVTDSHYKTNNIQIDELIQELHPEAYNDETILVIEDDPDMMEQIKSRLSVYFHVKGCIDGASALAMVNKEQPALIVCDVMLPDINGYNIVKQLKKSEDTTHIPVIMLTALDDDQHQLRSYTAGADDYMVKPCNFRLLIARCVQLIQSSKTIQNHISSLNNKVSSSEKITENPTVEKMPQLVMTQADKLFKEKLQMYISQHISDPQFTVDQLAMMLGIGRTTLFSKSKAMFGISPNKYLQNERMRIAADLLADGELSVSEVSYRVGIQDSSYFNKCFKAKYGVVPSKYVREVKEN